MNRPPLKLWRNPNNDGFKGPRRMTSREVTAWLRQAEREKREREEAEKRLGAPRPPDEFGDS